MGIFLWVYDPGWVSLTDFKLVEYFFIFFYKRFLRLTKVKLVHPSFSFLTLTWLVFYEDGLCNTHLNLRMKVPKVFRSGFSWMIMQRLCLNSRLKVSNVFWKSWKDRSKVEFELWKLKERKKVEIVALSEV